MVESFKVILYGEFFKGSSNCYYFFIIVRETDSGKKKEIKHFVPRPNYLFFKL